MIILVSHEMQEGSESAGRLRLPPTNQSFGNKTYYSK